MGALLLKAAFVVAFLYLMWFPPPPVPNGAMWKNDEVAKKGEGGARGRLGVNCSVTRERKQTLRIKDKTTCSSKQEEERNMGSLSLCLGKG